MGRVWSKAVWGAAVAFWLMVPAPATAQYGHKKKLDKPLSEVSSSGEPRQVIIRTKPGAKLHLKNKLAARGHRVLKDHKIVDAVTVRVDPKDIRALASDPDVESISLDAPVTSSAGGSKKSSGAGSGSGGSGSGGGDGSPNNTSDYQNTISSLKQTLGLGNWFPGSSVTIAVIDSGIAPLKDFEGRIIGFHDFTNGKNGEAVAPYDDYGHGSHVAGLAGSSGVTSANRYAGVAPGVKLLALRVLNKRGDGMTSQVIHAIEFAVANKDRYGIRIINLSLGHPIYESAATDPLVLAVEAAVRAGIIVVTAAGNCGTNPTTGLPGYGGIASPGNAPSAITVGAANTNATITRTDDRVTFYSSRGPTWFDALAKPDIVAPGQGMVSSGVDGSTLAVEYPSLVIQDGTTKYLKLNGSSMATGVVSGLVAVMLEANQYGSYMRWSQLQASLPNAQRTSYVAPRPLTANAIKGMLQYTATPLHDANGNAYDALTQGTGLVNGLGSIALAFYADTTRAAGSFWLTTTVPPTTMFGDTEQTWSQSLIWGTTLVKGSSLIELNQLAWADNIVWGTGEMDDIVWGSVDENDNLVWGTSLAGLDISWLGNAFLGDNIVWGTFNWADNIVWGTCLLGFFDGDNIVWGTLAGDHIVWGTLSDDNIVWGTNDNKVTILGTSLIGGGL